MKHNKNLEQRTFLQDRFEILMKKQKKGQATFTELTELDEIVNRYATIREQILEEMHDITAPPDGPAENGPHYITEKPGMRLVEKIQSFFKRVFMMKIADLLALISAKSCSISI